MTYNEGCEQVHNRAVHIDDSTRFRVTPTFDACHDTSALSNVPEESELVPPDLSLTDTISLNDDVEYQPLLEEALLDLISSEYDHTSINS